MSVLGPIRKMSDKQNPPCVCHAVVGEKECAGSDALTEGTQTDTQRSGGVLKAHVRNTDTHHDRSFI